ncbi:hypothetical protein FO615_06070 [Riemerella anatipestifer]|uniref:hypothetical protein n=1 Tax=Riemerella anatipestifer TaxID=34085 RepID=UPI002363DE68|nr:hypothetical protein [Riemerella anatipestifer]MDD1553143.1 hypothetical protein [Riemerella anatipestifer]MDD1596166.1 hypothetical protein [Riemerella anatipestifer]MDY3334247.1 hypothetical protein [Riemerella anatipestifer]MDY3380706.1 hypothetical protein [Riemerella anatipestifer]MDY3384613.1 hypothetical protein [Riemerella anatipestifer]
MNKKCFKLTKPIGTLIVSSLGDYTIEGIPSNALELIEKGCLWLEFTSEAVESLSKLSNERLDNLKKLRESQLIDDAEIINQAIQLKASEKKSSKS